MSSSTTASRLLARYGEAVVLSYMIGGVVNPATGDVTTPPTTVTINAFGYPSRYQKDELVGDSVQSTDIRLVLEKISTRPEQNWKALVDSVLYRIMDVRPIRKAGADVIYICQCRKN